MAETERVILAFGDSNTHGTLPMRDLQEMARLGPRERWPGVMAAELGPSWRMIEEGHPARTTVHPDPVAGVHKNALAVLPALLESHLPLDLVVIMLGTNDLKARFAVPAVEIAVSVERLVLTVRQSFAGPGGGAPRVLLIAPPPVLEAGCLAEIFAGGARKSQELARHYAGAAQRRGAGFLDAGRVIRSSPLDGVHFDAEQHARLGRAVAGAVRDLEL
jgi:lysophospholipase L1-like esterase